jgi:hypothetical protein
MSDSAPEPDPLAGTTPEERLTTLFASMVMQQTNMALMCLGQAPHPDTNRVERDLDAARLFIDQLEMIEAKTKGNLTPQEDKLLKQSLMTLRMAFVEAVEQPAPSAASPSPAAPQTSPSSAAQAGPAAAGSETDESRKKFVKKY